VTTIEDTPGLWAGDYGTNILQFELILKSSPNCKCDEEEKEKKICLEIYVRLNKNGLHKSEWSEIDCPSKKFPTKKYPTKK